MAAVASQKINMKGGKREEWTDWRAEPPSPMSHAGILARHAYKEDKLPPLQDQADSKCRTPTKSRQVARTEYKTEKGGINREGSRKFSLGSKIGGFFGRRNTGEISQRSTPREKDEDEEATVVVETAVVRRSHKPSTPSKKQLVSTAASPSNKQKNQYWNQYQVGISRPPVGSPLLGPKPGSDRRITLILDLDETLVRSSFDCTFEFDFEAPFALNGCWCTARVRKRPFVDEFLARVSKHFELIVMTAGVEPYASLVLDILDQHRYLEHRFYRDSCTKTEAGLLVKDLSRMSRDMDQTIIVDNSPNAYLWHPQNAVDIDDFVGDPRDTQLTTVADFLEVIKDAADVRAHLPHWRKGKHYAQVYNQNAKLSSR